MFLSRGFQHDRLLISITGNIFGSHNIHETKPTVLGFDTLIYNPIVHYSLVLLAIF